MAGNVTQWCQDWNVSYPGSGDDFDYTGTYRVWRGGDWGNSGYYSRCAYRLGSEPGNYNYGVGFRLAR